MFDFRRNFPRGAHGCFLKLSLARPRCPATSRGHLAHRTQTRALPLGACTRHARTVGAALEPFGAHLRISLRWCLRGAFYLPAGPLRAPACAYRARERRRLRRLPNLWRRKTRNGLQDGTCRARLLPRQGDALVSVNARYEFALRRG